MEQGGACPQGPGAPSPGEAGSRSLKSGDPYRLSYLRTRDDEDDPAGLLWEGPATMLEKCSKGVLDRCAPEDPASSPVWTLRFPNCCPGARLLERIASTQRLCYLCWVLFRNYGSLPTRVPPKHLSEFLVASLWLVRPSAPGLWDTPSSGLLCSSPSPAASSTSSGSVLGPCPCALITWGPVVWITLWVFSVPATLQLFYFHNKKMKKAEK